MTKLLNLAVEAAQTLPPEEQDKLARTILGIIYEADEGSYILSESERAAIERSRVAARRGEFATDDQIKAILSKYS